MQQYVIIYYIMFASSLHLTTCYSYCYRFTSTTTIATNVLRTKSIYFCQVSSALYLRVVR